MTEYEPIDKLAISEIEGQLSTICLETGKRIVASVQSPSASTWNDLGVCISDVNGGTVAEALNWMPIHIHGAHIMMEGVFKYFPVDKIYPGDFIVSNDPFVIKAGHLPDWSFILPVFYKDELICFIHAKTHQFDSGGAYTAGYFPRGYDVHSEGLIIPPTKVFERGKENEVVYELILKNVRGRQIVRWDNMAIRGSLMKGADRLIHLCDVYGPSGVKEAFAQTIKTTEEAMRTLISTWPAGTYHAERSADWDGTIDTPVWVRMDLTVKPEEGQLIFDLTKSDADRDYINVPLGHTKSTLMTAIYHAIPTSIPHNQGVYNCVTLITKPGTVCDPVYPQTNGAQGMTMGTQIAECGQLVMSQVVPKNTCASFSRHISPIVTGKIREVIDPRTGGFKNYRMVAFTSDGGSGATWGYDGWESVGPIINGGGAVRTPLEIAERDAPYRYLVSEWITDSAGDGEFKGCCGTHIQLLNEHDPKYCVVGDAFIQTGNSDGEKSHHFGIMGGSSSPPNEAWIRRGNRLTVLRMEDIVSVEPGDLMETHSGGGGGVGDPLNRDVEKVRWDALNRYISIDKAKNVYGTVLNPKTFEVDLEATNKLRARKKTEKNKRGVAEE